MKNIISLSVALLVLATSTLTGCSSLPSLNAIKYGYSPQDVAVTQEARDATDYNNMASGWAPTPGGLPESALQGGQVPGGNQLVGWDGSVVGASAPGSVTTTTKPINGGVAAQDGGSRSTLLDLYTDAANDREILTRRSEDLSIALEMSETRAADLQEQLKSLQIAYDELGKEKQGSDQATFDLAARLETAQIARLEAERALLEATIEWRRMSAENNKPLSGGAPQRPGRGQQP